MRALYQDNERAEEKRKELSRKREEGGTYLELSEGGFVQYSEWTCPHCLTN